MNLTRVASLLVLTALVGCSTPKFSVLPALGSLEVSGDIGARSGSQNVAGTTSLDQLRLTDSETAFMPRVDIAMGPHISVNHMAGDFSGTGGTVNAEFSYEGQTINANSTVNTDFNIAASNAMFTWDLVPGDIEFGIGISATFIDLELRMEEPGTSTIVQPDAVEGIPLPLPAARFGWDLGDFLVNAQLGWIALEVDDDTESVDAEVLDYDINVAYKIFNATKLRGMAVLGYRQFLFNLEGTDGADSFNFDFDFGGPYVGVNLVL